MTAAEITAQWWRVEWARVHFALDVPAYLRLVALTRRIIEHKATATGESHRSKA